MKKILIQLDTDQHPSAFDAIAAYDADVDVVLGFGEVTAENLAGLVQGAIFPRGPSGLANTAFWVGGSSVRAGEAVFDQLGVDDPSHAFYLGKELMKATIARGLRKSYRQEGPLDWGLLSFPEPRREDATRR